MPPENDSALGEFVPPSPGDLDALLPDYEVHELIAQGGMGAIYRGLQTKLDRPVAIKVLPRLHGADLDYAARFEQEAKAMAKLSHSNIVGVFDYGETSDGALLYFIMEYVEGSDLFHLLRKGSLSYADGIPVLRQICAALDYAHENGIVHRDIKPANILIDSDGNVKMADFGLAKMQKGAGAEDEEETAFGTPDYVAPETLVEGVAIDKRADIYSLGVLIYEVLTGGVPKGAFELPSVKIPGVDRRFDDIILKTVAPDRDERFSDVSQVTTILDAIEKTPRLVAAARAAAPVVPAVATTKGPASRAVSKPARRPQPVPSGSNNAFVYSALALLFISSAGAVYWFGFREPPAPPPDTADLFPGPDSHADPADDAKPPDDPGMTTASGSDTRVEGAIPGNPGGTARPRSGEDVEFFGANSAPGSGPKPADPEPGTPPATSAETAAVLPGGLRADGKGQDLKEVALQRVEGLTGFKILRTRNRLWTVLGDNGEVYSAGDNYHGMTGVRWIDARARYHLVVKEDGTIWTSKDRQLFPGEISDAVKAVGGYHHNAVLREDGSVKLWGVRYEGAAVLVDPPAPLSNIVDIAAGQDIMVAIDAEGRAYCWGKTLEVNVREPEGDGDRIVDVEAGVFHFVALTRSGRVVEWATADPGRTRKVPEELGPAIAVRAGNGTSAAQRPDGTWLAWGNNSNGIVDRINSLGPTPDIAFSSGNANDEEYGFVIWVEPPENYAPGEGKNDRILEVFEKSKQRYGSMAEESFLEELAKLNTLYLSGLERGAAAAESEGDTFSASRIREDRAAAGKAIADAEAGNAPAPEIVGPAGAAVTSDRLRGLRDTYRRELEKLKTDRDTRAKAVLNTYISDLESLRREMEKYFGAVESAKVQGAIDRARETGVEILRSENP